MDWGNLKDMKRETIYLIVGDDIAYLDKESVQKKRVHSVDYFTVGGACVIKGRTKYLCSCGYEICWHSIRVSTFVETTAEEWRDRSPG
ncbi:uncharacterized protein Eint_010885 [Encephalitozoon intestinalis ATCC 50506]|uniref:SWIM-type domain-containing protein n=1 Tax=Encephalitozoon intestinalis (strain ATCC 50506) TaxID=876142 RepID=W8PKD2_ENCIT|nr:uncharacterized protein Eint_010885 [Encephalitozoon intestinalis ATCC 50506]AHL30070.1 hypothetical protein Eint_010885 [Encephalitozoon intestinalis ATCC 50506]UTX44586.1 hypothetical protein GPK93_01g00960 [Encephalitozoon intestinalis]